MSAPTKTAPAKKAVAKKPAPRPVPKGRTMMEDPEVVEWDDEWLVRRGIYLTLITPEVAARLLEANTNNRRLKERSITQWAEEMTAGRWDPDASDIKIARTGELIDGQHRLHACVRAGVPFPTVVRTGLATATKAHIDIGVKRTVSDIFRMEQVPWATNTAAAIVLRRDYIEGEAEGAKVNDQRRHSKSTPEGALEFLREHPMHEKMNQLADQMYRVGPNVARTVYFAFLPMAAEQDEAGARAFAESFVSGEIAGAGNPVLALTRYVASARVPQGLRIRNINQRNLLALVKAWNAWRTGSPLERLVVRDTDALQPLA